MSELQQEAVWMISQMSDDNIYFLMEVIRKLIPQSEKINTAAVSLVNEDKRMQAFKRLDAARAEISQYLPDDFEPEKELEKARAGLSPQATQNIRDICQNLSKRVQM